MAVTDITRRLTFFTPGRLIAFWLVALAIYFLTPLHKAVAWVALDVATLNAQVDGHMRSMHGTAEYACLYTVVCPPGRDAELQLRTRLTQAELEQVKNTIWRRRFEGYCPGRTTNFGLENSGEAEALARGWDTYRRRDVWTSGGGFMGESSRFSGGSFAPFNGWTPCTRDKAYWTREDGIVARR
jgi:hypothetical protein